MRFGTSFASCRFGSSNARSIVGTVVVTEPIPPVEPSGASLIVTWDDNSAIEDGFRIRRRLTSAGGAYTLAATVGPNIEAATLTGLAYGTSYDVTVAAFNGAGEYSTVGPITRYTPPEFAPTALTAGAITSSTVAVGFTAAAGVTKYQGYYRAGTSGAWLVGPAITSGTSINFVGLTSSTAYQFKIRGYFTNPDIEGVAQTSSYSPDSVFSSITTAVNPNFMQFDFDGGEGNYSNWTNLSSAGSNVNFASTRLVHSGNCVELTESSTSWGGVLSPTFTAAPEYHFFFAYKSQGGPQTLIGFGDLYVRLEGFGASRAVAWLVGGSQVAISGEIAPHAVAHYYWIYIKRSTGSGDGVATICFSTTPNKPSFIDSSNSLTISHNITAAITAFSLQKTAGGGGQYTAYDYIRGSYSEIGSNPT